MRCKRWTFTTSGYHGYKENSKFKIVGQTKRDTTFKIAKLKSASKFTWAYKKWTKSVHLFIRYECLKTATLRTALRPAIYSNSAWRRNLSSPFFKHSYLLNKLKDFVQFLYAYVNFDADFNFVILKVVSLFVCPTNSNCHYYLLPW